MVAGMRIAQSVSLDCGDVVAVVLGTWIKNAVGDDEEVRAVALAYETVDVANF